MKLQFKHIVLALLGITSSVGFAQQEAQFTQYMYNTSTINPAYAGSRGGLTLFGQYRSQWVGLEGAPKTTSLTLNAPINYSKLGYGVSFISDKLGAMSDNTIAVDLSYTIDVSYDYKLALGVKVSGNFLNVDYDKLTIYDPTEGTSNITNQFTPNIGAGAYLYSDKTYFGLSVPYFLEQDRNGDNNYATMKQTMHIYAMAGHVFDISPEFKLKPALLAKVIQNAPLQLDISANALISNKLTLGASYRLSSAFSALAGFQLSDQVFIGYSYDSEVTKLANYNNGSHEILLRFELFNKYKRLTSPRFF
nr:type IX secretion system membrane protein PorP/SprF [uncultured Flavobacterium sp.]